MELKTFLLALLVVVLMGSSVVIEKASLKGGSPLIIFTLRSCFMTLALLAVVFITGRYREMAHISFTTHSLVVTAALMGMVFLVLYYTILKQDLASRVFPILSIAPVVTLLCSVLFLGEPFTWRRLIGILLAVLGVALIR